MFRRFVHDLFYIPKHSKEATISDKAFVANIVVSVVMILLCLSLMGFSAYAWFESTASSDNSVIMGTSYGLDISVNGQVIDTAVIRHTVQQPADYEVRITKQAASTATTGFCVVSVDLDSNGTVDAEYYTAQIGKDAAVSADFVRGEYVLYLRINSAATVRFEAHWGTSEHYYHAENNPLYLVDGETDAVHPLEIGQFVAPPQNDEQGTGEQEGENGDPETEGGTDGEQDGEQSEGDADGEQDDEQAEGGTDDGQGEGEVQQPPTDDEQTDAEQSGEQNGEGGADQEQDDEQVDGGVDDGTDTPQ